MSSIYVSEPPTKGKVVLNTTMGPLDIELWPKEAPKATRNFVQLCLEGYYDRTIFHRIIKSFLVQGGDPTSSGTGGESIYGAPFSDEFHSRLRFNHRGLVACANAGTKHSNGSQFFITLDRCNWLDKKNTIFGKVTGDSVYNLLRIGEVETDKVDWPLDPQPKILSVEVLWNPFDDIVPRQVPNKSLTSAKTATENQDLKKKAVKKLNLLSFGEEAEEDEIIIATVKEKIQSIHDVLDDPRFLKEQPDKKSLPVDDNKKGVHITVREALSSKNGKSDEKIEKDLSDSHGSDEGDDDDDDGARFDARMRMQILKKRQERGEVIGREKSASEEHNVKGTSVSSSRKDVKDEDRGSRVEKLAIRKKGIGSEARAERMAKADADLQLLGHAEQERQVRKQKRRRLQGREDDTLAKLNKFKQSLTANHKVPESGEEEDVSNWREDELKFNPEHSNKDGMTWKGDPNDYVVLDPLLEKGKEKFNKMQAKLKRREREWAGKSLT